MCSVTVLTTGHWMSLVIMYFMATGTPAREMDMCAANTATDTHLSLRTPQYPRPYSVSRCQCRVTSDADTRLVTHVLLADGDVTNGCRPVIRIESTSLPFTICADHVTRGRYVTQLPRDGHLVIALENEADEYIKFMYDVTAVDGGANVTAVCGGGSGGLGPWGASGDTGGLSDPKQNETLAAILTGVAMTVIICVVTALLIVRKRRQQRLRAEKDAQTTIAAMASANHVDPPHAASVTSQVNPAYQDSTWSDLEGGMATDSSSLTTSVDGLDPRLRGLVIRPLPTVDGRGAARPLWEPLGLAKNNGCNGNHHGTDSSTLTSPGNFPPDDTNHNVNPATLNVPPPGGVAPNTAGTRNQLTVPDNGQVTRFMTPTCTSPSRLRMGYSNTTPQLPPRGPPPGPPQPDHQHPCTEHWAMPVASEGRGIPHGMMSVAQHSPDPTLVGAAALQPFPWRHPDLH